MNIKDTGALSQLCTDIVELDKLVNQKRYDSLRKEHGELFSLIQGLDSRLNASINFSKSDELDELIKLSDQVIDAPSNVRLVSRLVDKTKNSDLQIDGQSVSRLDFFKGTPSRVVEFASTINAQLKGILRNS